MTEGVGLPGPSAQGPERELAVGDEVELDIGSVAHQGVCVARAAGRVVFVRYALPGERAVVRITEAKRGSFGRGEAIRIVRAHPQRVAPPCVHFGPGGCGGCDFQQASADLQRRLKAAVVGEQFRRLAGVDVAVEVEALPTGGLRWRSRVRWAVGQRSSPDVRPEGHQGGSGPGLHDAIVGPRRYRSHDVVPVSGDEPCLIAGLGLTEAADAFRPPQGVDEVAFVSRREGRAVAVPIRRGRGRRRRGSAASSGTSRTVTEQVRGRSFDVAVTGFWQAHYAAAEVLSAAVEEALSDFDLDGRRAWDLYGGVGLFSAVLAERVGGAGNVVTVESDPVASHLAAANLVDVPQVSAVTARVDRFLARAAADAVAVVLDPPRTGAGAGVCREIAGRRPAVIVYVACDPAALARDSATLMAAGYRLDRLRAFDAFPQTHHVECVARFVPA